MLAQKKRMVFSAFAVIYLSFLGLVAWLLFFNEGLDITVAEQEGVTGIFVENTGSREILNVTVFAQTQNEKIVLAHVRSLKPKEKVLVDTQKIAGKGNVLLAANAPFYRTVQKTLFSGGALRGMDLSVQTPQAALANTKTVVEIQACNKSSFEQKLFVGIELEKEFFEQESLEKELIVKQAECQKQGFEITPRKTGITTIYFNIKANDYNEKIERQIEVK